jgi:hypothetical protein
MTELTDGADDWGSVTTYAGSFKDNTITTQVKGLARTKGSNY